MLPFAPELFGPLCSTIRQLLIYGGEVGAESTKPFALLVYEERFDVSSFYIEVSSFGLEVEFVPDEDLSPVYRDPGRIFALRLTLSHEGFQQ